MTWLSSFFSSLLWLYYVLEILFGLLLFVFHCRILHPPPPVLVDFIHSLIHLVCGTLTWFKGQKGVWRDASSPFLALAPAGNDLISLCLRNAELCVCVYIYIYIYFFFLTTPCGLWILVPQPGIETMPQAVKAWSPNHRTAREVPSIFSYTWKVAQWGSLLHFSLFTAQRVLETASSGRGDVPALLHGCVVSTGGCSTVNPASPLYVHWACFQYLAGTNGAAVNALV